MNASADLYLGCPVQHALAHLGGKWQMGILWNLRDGELRFGELRGRLPGLSEKVLAAELRFFEEAGVVAKQIFAEVPSRVEYRLTTEGRRLLAVVGVIIKWGYAHLQDQKVSPAMRRTPKRAISEIRALRRKRLGSASG